MSKGIFGWDLPPGCSVSDIPGNRPEDAKWEAIIENFFDVERIKKRKYGIPINDAQIKIMDDIYTQDKFNDIQEAVDYYIIMAIEYGIDIGSTETLENHKYDEAMYKDYLQEKRNLKLITFFKRQREKIRQLENEIENLRQSDAR